ncbi:MAG: energy transducer TonB [Thermoanaerobaculia bacterium]
MRFHLLCATLFLAACRAREPVSSTPASSPSPTVLPVPSPIPTPLQAAAVTRQPRLISSAKPRFPVSGVARQARSNVYVFEALINEAGVVSNVRTVRKADITPEWPELEEACRQAVLSWRYEPAVHQGRPVPVYLTVSVLVDF